MELFVYWHHWLSNTLYWWYEILSTHGRKCFCPYSTIWHPVHSSEWKRFLKSLSQPMTRTMDRKFLIWVVQFKSWRSYQLYLIFCSTKFVLIGLWNVVLDWEDWLQGNLINFILFQLTPNTYHHSPFQKISVCSPNFGCYRFSYTLTTSALILPVCPWKAEFMLTANNVLRCTGEITHL